MSHMASHFGPLLREWRQRRRISQLELACQGNISTRHLSFLETGRSRPSRDMVLHLAEQLEVPLRERNQLLAAAGFAPVYRESALTDPDLRAARRAMEAVIHGHMPHPALAVDRHWNLVFANDAVGWLLAEVDPALLRPPVNVLRLALHPAGLAPHTLNLPTWRAHLLGRLQRQVEVSADPGLAALLAELRGYSMPQGTPQGGHRGAMPPDPGQSAVIPLDLATPFGTLSLIGMTAVFGTPADITLSELAMECFYPANEATARLLAAEMRQRASAASSGLVPA
jgi:transcriptional regulator with XRE-family HTH domain